MEVIKGEMWYNLTPKTLNPTLRYYDEGGSVGKLLWLLVECAGWVHRGEQECLASGNLGHDSGLLLRNTV